MPKTEALAHFTRKVLERLAQAENGLTIAEAREDGPNRMQTLVGKGLAQATPDSVPGRTARYVITEAGRDLLRAADTATSSNVV